MQEEPFVTSYGGVRVYKRLEDHPLLSGTDLSHPDLLRKAEECFTRGNVKGLPKICSENSEDALTWHHFSPLLKPTGETGKWLKFFLDEALDGRASPGARAGTASAQLHFWHGRKTLNNVYSPPPSRACREGDTEVDLTIELGRHALVFVEAKHKSPVQMRTKYDETRDQIIRNVDVGSWHTGQRGFAEFYFILVTADRDPNKAHAQLMSRYRPNPDGLRTALPYRDDLTDQDFAALAGRIGWITWDELPMWGAGD